MQERTLVGLDALEAVVTLLRRNRAADPLHGVWEAADFCWWWRVERATDTHPQVVWFDGDQPVAAIVATQWGDRTGLAPLTLPGADADVLAQVVQRGAEHAVTHGMTDLDVRTVVTDGVLHVVLEALGFVADHADGADAEGWIECKDRPPVSVVADDYRLVDRTVMAAAGVAHHFVPRSAPDVEDRLRQTPLYRPDLDLVVLDAEGRPVADGLCWFDPVTRHLYPDVGFVPTRSTVVFRR